MVDGRGLEDTQDVTVNLNDVNEAPDIAAGQAFDVAAGAPNGTSVGTVVATDPDAGDTLTYAIVGGNTDNAFAINADTGEITVNNVDALDFETNPTFALSVRVVDGGALEDTETVTVNLTNVNEAPGVGAGQSFGVEPGAANGTSVGTVTATDPDAGDTLAYAIVGGNTDNAFAINADTGEITVNNTAALDPLTNPAFVLSVQVTDSGALTDAENVAINYVV